MKYHVPSLPIPLFIKDYSITRLPCNTDLREHTRLSAHEDKEDLNSFCHCWEKKFFSNLTHSFSHKIRETYISNKSYKCPIWWLCKVWKWWEVLCPAPLDFRRDVDPPTTPTAHPDSLRDWADAPPLKRTARRKGAYWTKNNELL